MVIKASMCVRRGAHGKNHSRKYLMASSRHINLINNGGDAGNRFHFGSMCFRNGRDFFGFAPKNDRNKAFRFNLFMSDEMKKCAGIEKLMKFGLVEV